MPKPAGLVRIVALGESTTANLWPSYLESLLRRRTGGARGLEVINAALPGYTVADQLIRYQQDVVPLTPDILVIYAGWNDLTSCSLFSPSDANLLRRWFETGDRAILAMLPVAWTEQHPAWFSERRTLARPTRDRRLQEDLSSARDSGPVVGALARDVESVRRAVQRDEFVFDEIDQGLDGDSIFDGEFDPAPVSSTLAAIASDAADRGIRVAFVIPAEGFGCVHVRAYRCSMGAVLTPADRSGFIRKTLPATLDRIAGATGATVIDVQAAFRASEDRCRFFAADSPGQIADELHTNELGRMAVALAVADGLAAHQLLELRPDPRAGEAYGPRAARELASGG